MAKVNIPKINIEKLLRNRPSNTEYDPQKQTEGLKKRLEASGIDPEDATDSRNFLEKMLNLEKDQNVLFDIFEVLERPQQALFGAIQASQKGKDVGKAALENFKGNEHTYGKDLLLEAGAVNDSKEKFGWDDALGLGLDVFADPIDIALIPATGGTKLIADATDAVAGANKMLDAAKLLGNADSIQKATKMVDLASNSLEAAKKVRLISARSLAGQTMKAGFRKGMNIADAGISRALGYIDTKNLEKLGKAKALQAEGFVKKLNTLDGYNDFKKYLKGVFKPDKRLPFGTWDKVFKLNAAEMLSKKETQALVEVMKKNIDDYAKLTGQTSEEVGRDIMMAIEYLKYKPSGAYIDFIKKPEQALNQQAYDAVKPLFDKVGIKIDDVYAKVDIDGNVGYLVKNHDVHKAFVKQLEDEDGLGAIVKQLQHAEWEKALPSNLNKNYFGRMKKGTRRVPTDVKKAFNNDVVDLIKKLKDSPVPIDRATKEKMIYDLFVKHGIEDIVDSGGFNIKRLNKFVTTTSDDLYISSRYEDVDTLLPRFFNKEKLERITKLYNENKAFKEVTDNSYAAKITIEETFSKIFDETFGGNNMRIKMQPGTVHHSETDEMARLRKSGELFPEYDKAPILRGKRSLLSSRDYKVSADEANSIYAAHVNLLKDANALTDKQKDFLMNATGIKLFKDTIQESVGDMIEYVPKLTKDTKMMEEILATSWLMDPDLIRPYFKADQAVDFYQHTPVPPGYSKVNRNDLIAELKGFEKYIGEKSAVSALIEGLEKKFHGSTDVVIENNIYYMIESFTDEKTTHFFLDSMDKVNSVFKKTKLLSPGFQIRNIIGNMFNMYAGGVPIRKIMFNFGKSHEIISKGDAVFKKAAQGLELTVKEQRILKWYKPFVENNFHEISRKLFDVGFDEAKLQKMAELEGFGSKVKKAVNFPINLNSKGNQFFDERYRLALFMYASENPEILQKFAVNTPAELVRKILFDPNDLSWAEKTKLRKFIPFYTFTKKNLVYQWENFGRNSKKYQHVQKSIRDTWKAMDLEVGTDVDQYKIEDFWIPVPFLDKDGNYRAIRAKLPIEDLGEMMENPLRKFVAASAPMIRAPYEFAANQQLFTQMPISEFKGQRGYMIPEVGRKTEYLLSQTGLDVPVAGVMDAVRTAKQGITGELAGKSGYDIAEQAVLRTVMSKGSAEQSSRNKAYQELDAIRELMKYYKQEGVDIVKLSDIENRSPAKAMAQRLREINASFR